VVAPVFPKLLEVLHVGRVKEKNRFSRRHSDFYLGLNGKDWLLSWQLFSVEAQALMQLRPQKRLFRHSGEKC
jgi:hypothetical protein